MENLEVPTGPGLDAESFYGDCNALRDENGEFEASTDSVQPGYTRLTAAQYWVDVTGILQLARPRFAERDLWVRLSGTVINVTTIEANVDITLHPLEVGALQWALDNDMRALVGVVRSPARDISSGIITIVLAPTGFIVPGSCSKFLIEESIREAVEGDGGQLPRVDPEP